MGCEGRQPAADIQRSDATGDGHDRLHRRDRRASDRQLRLRIQSRPRQHRGVLVGANGALTLVEYEPTRGRTPRNFAIDPSGRWLIAANERSDTLAVFSIDQASGSLSPVGPLASVGAPVSVLFME